MHIDIVYYAYSNILGAIHYFYCCSGLKAGLSWLQTQCTYDTGHTQQVSMHTDAGDDQGEPDR